MPHTFGCPHIFGCTPVCLDAPICLDPPCMFEHSYVWMPPVCLNTPICLHAPICFDAPCMFGRCLDAPCTYTAQRKHALSDCRGVHVPHTFGCSNVWMPLHVWTPSCMFGCPQYVWTPPICLDAFHIFACPPVYTQHK